MTRIRRPREAIVDDAFLAIHQLRLTPRAASLFIWLVVASFDDAQGLIFDRGREGMYIGVGRDPRAQMTEHEAVAANKAVQRSLKELVEKALVERIMPAGRGQVAVYRIHVPTGDGTGHEITDAPVRRTRSSDCYACETATASTPHHDPSPHCQSGSRPHCTCDICY